MPLRIRRPFFAAVLIPILATCGGTEPSGPAPASLVVTVALPDSVADRTPLAQAPAVRLVDGDGVEIAVAGVPITIHSQTLGVTIIGTTTRNTDESGVATFEDIRFQGPAGLVVVRFSAPTLPSLDVGGVTLTAGVPVSVTPSEITLLVPVSELVPAFDFWVRDSSGNSVAGVPVLFAVTEGGGSAPDTGVTGADGRAHVTAWRVGTTLATNRLVASIPSAVAPPLQAEVAVTTGPGKVARLLLAATWPAPARAGKVVPTPLKATVSDTFGHPITGQPVVFLLTQLPTGQQTSLVKGTVNTDESGEATLPSLDLSTVAGPWRYGAAVVRLGTTTLRDTLVPVVPDSMVAIVAEWQGGKWPVGIPLTSRVAVRDQYQNRFPGMSVDLAVDAGGGTAARIDTLSAADGWMRFTWTPGSLPTQRLLLSAAGVPSETLSVTPIAPADLILESADSLSVVAGQHLPNNITIRVVDSVGIGMENVPVKLSRNGVFVKSWLTASDGRVSFANVEAGPGVGDIAYAVSSDWLPGDTVTTTVHVVAGPPTSLTAVGPLPTFEVGTLVAGPLVLKLTDPVGNGLAGFRFALQAYSGRLADDSATTDSLGFLTVPAWELGTVAGGQTLLARSGTFIEELTFTVLPGPVASLTLSRVPAGFAAESIGVAPRFTARDSFGNPTSGDTLTLSVTAGGGSVPATMIFDSRGVADVVAWVLGPVPGPNTLHAEAGGQTLDVSATSTPASPYNIVIRGVDIRYVADFRAAAFQWRRRITADVVNIHNVVIPAGDCSDTQEAFVGTIDDLLIDAHIGGIDGPGGILGGAFPCYIRNTTFLPLVGVMEFDIADMTALETEGTLDDVILHEMGHVLGIGTTWTARNLLANAGTANPQFTGPGGRAGWAAIGGPAATGLTNVPVENTGGGGTRDAHWRESLMPSELMTGWLSALVNPMSAVTVRSLGDLGYTIDPTTADPYTAMTAPPVEPGRGGVRIRDRVEAPRFSVDEHGKVTPIR